MQRRAVMGAGIALSMAVLALPGAASASGARSGATAASGHVYVLNNRSQIDRVWVYDRAADGSLTPAGRYATGGTGTNAGLGSQGALALSQDGRWLLAVNAGSSEVSVFWVQPDRLVLASVTHSGGTMPISVAVRGSLVYVLNAGGNGNISGFRLTPSGTLNAIPHATRPLSTSASGPAEVAFSPSGTNLVVTEKATNTLSTYLVLSDGRAVGPTANPSSGTTPFGFAFGRGRQLFVSEAFGGAPDASAVSAYSLKYDGTLTTASPSVATTETAACWVVVTHDDRFVYTTNTGSGTVTGYRVGVGGTITILDADGVTGSTGPGSKPTDAAVTPDDAYLYALDSGTHTLSGFRIGVAGQLIDMAIPSLALPTYAVGLVSD